jgi:hypothetical protein
MDLSNYVEVKDRLREARAIYTHMRVIERPPAVLNIWDTEFLVCTVEVHRDENDPRPMVAQAWEPRGRTPYTKDSELMVGMTSALGRALGYMGFGIAKSIASANEVRNRATESPQIDATAMGGTKPPGSDADASEAQKRAIYMISKKKGVPMPDVNGWTRAQASAWIEEQDKQ